MTINEALDYIHAVDWRRSSLGLRDRKSVV